MELFNLDSFSVQSSPQSTPSVSVPKLEGEQERYTILAVDDTPSNLHLIQRMLHRQPQLSLVTAKSGIEALDIVQHQAIDLILMDMIMPGMDGVETCQHIRKIKEYTNIPIIFMTAMDDTSSKLMGLSVAMDYLVKPFDADEFLARVRIHLRLLSLTRQLQVRNGQLQQEIQERQQAETQLQRRNRRLLLLNNIVDDIRSSLEPEQILAVAAIKIGQALEADYCCIYTLRDEDQTLELAAEYLEGSLAQRSGDGNAQGHPSETADDRSPTPTAEDLKPEPFSPEQFSPEQLVSGLGTQLPRNNPWMEARLTEDAVLALSKESGAMGDDGLDLPISLPLQALLACRASYRDRPNGLVLAGHYRTPRAWSGDDRELLGNVAAHLGVALNQAYLLKQERLNSEQLQQRNVVLSQQEAELRSLNAQLHQLATRDGLTLLSNRRAFDERLRQLWASPQSPTPQIGLLMCDVDYFKRYNDNYGHPAGDECLRRVADILKRSLLRNTDMAARYGGEEFVMVLPGSDEEGAIAVAQRVLELLAAEKIPHAYSELGDHLTLSIGVACLNPQEYDHPKVLLDSADQALYAAKSQGRNRYCILPQPVT